MKRIISTWWYYCCRFAFWKEDGFMCIRLRLSYVASVLLCYVMFCCVISDHWWGGHSVHDQLSPGSNWEHPSPTHQDTGLLDSAPHWHRLRYSQVGTAVFKRLFLDYIQKQDVYEDKRLTKEPFNKARKKVLHSIVIFWFKRSNCVWFQGQN